MGFFEQIKDDVVFLRGALRALKMTTPIAKNPTRVFPRRDRGTGGQIRRRAGADLRPRALQLPRRWPSARTATRAGRWREGLAKGETVCLLMPNRPEYMAIWIGITRVGGVVALLNTNLVGPSLAHCIDIVAPKHIIVAAELAPALRDRAAACSRPRRKVWSHGESAEFPAHRPRDRRPVRRPLDGFRAPPRSPSRTARSTSTPPAPPACPRPPTSTTTG